MTTTWMYLTDLSSSSAQIINLETGELRSVMSNSVDQRAPAGLRRYLLEELGSGDRYRETGEVLPITAAIADDIDECYHDQNSWNYDWPNVAVESLGDNDPSLRDRIVTQLSAEMAQYPYEFEITGLQRRYLMYYSDGDYKSQKRFERLIPSPKSSPFRRDGSLRRSYSTIYNSIMRDAKVPLPTSNGHSLRPCLYVGAAWVVRFKLDGKDVLLDRCRVYVDDDANFICSDWCQRHDYSSYGSGINLQQGIYTFGTWVTGPCLIRNVEQGFTPKNATVTRTAVRDLMKRAPAAMPTFDAAFAKANAQVSKYAKASAAPTVDAGPITADAMAEAMAEAEKIISAKVIAAPALESDPVISTPVPIQEYGVWRVAQVPVSDRSGQNTPYTVAFRVHAEKVEVCMINAGLSVSDAIDNLECNEYFRMDDQGFQYLYNDDDNTEDISEPLTENWWLWSAAVFYRDNVARLESSSLASILTTLNV